MAAESRKRAGKTGEAERTSMHPARQTWFAGTDAGI